MGIWVEFKKLYKVGEGGYGKVYKVQEVSTGNMYAVKVSKLSSKQGLTRSTLREISQLKALNDSPYIVSLVGSRLSYGKKTQQPKLYLIFELMDTDLFHFIFTFRVRSMPMPALFIKSIAYQILKGTAFCHVRGVIHRDMKTANILVDLDNGRIKIADFGVARFYTIPCDDWTTGVCTLSYRGPEDLLGGRRYSLALDMWSVGCIIGEMVNRTPLFHAKTETEVLQLIFGALGVPDERSWPGVSLLPHWKLTRGHGPAPPLSHVFPTAEPLLLDLLSKLLVFNPAKRLSAKEAMKHPYFDDLDTSQL